MLIGVISDTHDNVINFRKALVLFNSKKVDLIFHLGDWVSPFMIEECLNLHPKIVSVFGNNEFDTSRFVKKASELKTNIIFHPKIAELDYDGLRMVLYHGEHKIFVLQMIGSRKYDVVFSGHTHIPNVERIGRTLHINPGSSDRNRTEDESATVALYESRSNSGEIVTITPIRI